jgi:hypothetical protein
LIVGGNCFQDKMRNLVTILCLTILSCSTKDKAATQISADTTEIDLTTQDETVFNGPCVFEKTGEINNTFPFNASDKVELVSYECRRDSYSNDNLIFNEQFSVVNIKQRVSLGKSQQDSVFSILYNYKPLPVGLDTLQADCYNPRHSIVFYEKSKAIAFFEICFECGGTRQSKGVDFGQFCPEKMCMLQTFFKTNGADFGVIDEMCE